jgi:hypothetical protein
MLEVFEIVLYALVAAVDFAAAIKSVTIWRTQKGRKELFGPVLGKVWLVTFFVLTPILIGWAIARWL